MATIGMVDGASTLGAGSQLPRPVSGTTHPQGVPAHGAEEHHEPLRMGHARRQEAQRPKRVVAVPLMCQEHQGPGSSVGPSMRQMAEMPAALSDYSPTRLFASVRTPHQPCIPLSSTQHAGEPGRRAQRAAAQSAQSRRLGRLAGNGRQGQDELLVVRAQRPGWSRGGTIQGTVPALPGACEGVCRGDAGGAREVIEEHLHQDDDLDGPEVGQEARRAPHVTHRAGRPRRVVFEQLASRVAWDGAWQLGGPVTSRRARALATQGCRALCCSAASLAGPGASFWWRMSCPAPRGAEGHDGGAGNLEQDRAS